MDYFILGSGKEADMAASAKITQEIHNDYHAVFIFQE